MNKTRKKELLQLLEKYQQGKCSENERMLLNDWLVKMDEITGNDVDFSSEKEAGDYHARIWQQLQSQIKAKSNNFRLRVAMRYAAGVAALIALFYFIAPPEINPLVAGVEWDTVRTENEMKEIQLADGSVLWLNTGTTVCFPVSFDKSKNRTVKLITGEAVFDVAHDSLKPFYVQSDKIKVRVLGTRFMVTDFKHLNESKVVVERGKVRVNHNWHELAELTKDQAIRYNARTKDVINEENHAWFDPQSRSVLLDNCSFQELAVRIKDIYGVALHASSEKAKNYRFTGEIYLDESFDITLYKFCAIHGGGCSQKGKEVFIN